ncbi:MAG: hypothetical protein AVDCRST_MAG32-1849, partial [uncultured Nocardioides sp.]
WTTQARRRNRTSWSCWTGWGRAWCAACAGRSWRRPTPTRGPTGTGTRPRTAP